MARIFSDWLAAYIEHHSVSEAPEVAHRWTGIWTIAGALRRNVWFDAGDFDWTPNFYIVLVGPPGVIQKSTTASKGTRLLAKIPGITFGPDSATWHGLLPKFVEAETEIVYGDRRFRCSPLTMAVSELGSFLKLSQEGLDAVLIDMWDGTIRDVPWTHTTQTHGDKSVWNGVLNLLGCTTLGWARESIPANALETGLLSRILFVYADAKREAISIPNRDVRWNPAEKKRVSAALLADLQQIAALRGPMTLTDEAYAWQDAWYKRIWERGRPAHMASERFDLYRSRKQSHVMKLALVMTAARGDTMQISLDTLQGAAKAVEAVEAGMVRIFETIGGPPEAQHAREITSIVSAVALATGKAVTTAELFRRLRNVMSYDDLSYGIRAACLAGTLRVVATEARDATGAAVLGMLPGGDA